MGSERMLREVEGVEVLQACRSGDRSGNEKAAGARDGRDVKVMEAVKAGRVRSTTTTTHTRRHINYIRLPIH